VDTLIHSRAAAEQYLELTKGITPALIFNPRAIAKAWKQLQSALPGVTLYYAVKSNPYESILRVLNAEGAQFDCASAPEIEALLKLGVSLDRVIHTHPIKTTNDLQISYDLGVRTFVVDNADELWKLVPFRRDVRIMLRLAFVAPDAPIDLSRKFGAQPEDAMELLSVAKHMGLEVDGLCFHVGSQAASATTHALALRRCFDIAKEAKERSIADITRIDMGGGFPANYTNQPINFHEFCAPINEVIKSCPAHIQLMAEPGRSISAPSMSLVSRVIGRSKRQDNVMWYYLDDGVYGAQSGRIYDHIDYPMHIFTDITETGPAVFAGPTCDSIDYLGAQTDVPLLSIGDVVVINEIGAYSVATACSFNGIQPPVIIDLDENQELTRMLA